MTVVFARIACSACALTSLLAGVADAQIAAPRHRVAMPASTVVVPSAAAARAAALAPADTRSRVLWIRNDLTGQVVVPGKTFSDRDDTTEAKEVFNSYDHTGGVSSINLSWNYPGAYTTEGFVVPEGGEPLDLALVNISSDPDDISNPLELAGNQKLSIVLEPWEAATWPGGDLNVAQPLASYQSALISISTEFEIRVFRSYLFSLVDTTLPHNNNDLSVFYNPYKLDAALSFAFLSFPGFDIASPFEFDLTGFEPPITTKGKGVILTHWLVMSERPPCTGDLNEDAIVDDADFQVFAAQYNIVDCAAPEMPAGCVADLNFDGFVDDADFTEVFVQAYNNVLCPEANVIRKVYMPLAGGRNRWDNQFNNPFEKDPITDQLPDAVPVGVDGWTSDLTPNALVKLAPTPFGVQTGQLPSYAAMRTSRSGLGRVAALDDDLPFDQLQVEYERFLNAVLFDPFAALTVHYFYPGPEPTPDSQWLSNSSPKKIKVLFPTAP
ncbi:MAG TPA: hypothetical protein VF777_01600 [Phycisphaerales bacterium]